MAAAHAGPDHPRGARVLLKDYCEGRLLYSHPPPGGWRAFMPVAVLPAAAAAGALETVDEASDRATAPASLATAGAGGEVAGAAGSRAIDNVLLPRAAHRHDTSAATAAAAAATVVGGASSAVRRAGDGVAAAAAAAAAHVDDDGQSSEGSLADDGELDIETLRAFGRKVVVQRKRGGGDEDDDGGGDDDDDDDEEGEEGDEHDGGRGGHGAVRAGEEAEESGARRAAAVAADKRNKKERDLVKPRRRRKGEHREMDPYGTSAVADAANRLYMMAEMAAVAVVPAMLEGASAPVVSAPATGTAAGTALRTGMSVTRQGGVTASKRVTASAGGAAVVDAVPMHLRGK